MLTRLSSLVAAVGHGATLTLRVAKLFQDYCYVLYLIVATPEFHVSRFKASIFRSAFETRRNTMLCNYCSRQLGLLDAMEFRFHI